MNFKRNQLAALALVMVGTILAMSGAKKTVTLVIDGQASQRTTYALTVGQFLRLSGIALAPKDEIAPKASSWISKGESVQIDRAVPVVVEVGGETIRIVSAERIPARLLEEAGVGLGSGDAVLVNGIPVDPEDAIDPSPVFAVEVRRAQEAALSNGKETLKVSSTAPTLGEALWDEGIQLRVGDRISPALDTPFAVSRSTSSGRVLEVSLQASRQVIIQHSRGETRLQTASLTVGEALAEAGMALQGMDISDPAPEEAIPASGRIRLIRVSERVVIEQSPLPYETEYQPAPEVDLDTQEVLQAGEYGLTATRIRVRYEDGVEVSRKSEIQWISHPPKNKIIGYGTNVVMHTTTTSDGATIQYWRALQMWATSYRPLETSNTTASGLPLKKGVAAIDTNYIAFGTQMYIPGYGNAVAADRGGGVRGRWIDLGYSNEDYVSWHQWVTVYFLWPPPANIVWVIP